MTGSRPFRDPTNTQSVAWGVMPDSDETMIMIRMPKTIVNQGASMIFLSKGEPFVVCEHAEDLIRVLDSGDPWLLTTIAGVTYITYIRASEVLAITALKPPPAPGTTF